jgi:hypothetical protein
MCVKVFVNGEDMTSDAFVQGNNLSKEIAFLLWFALGADRLSDYFVSGFAKYHKAPRRTNLKVPGKGNLIYIKEKSGMVFEVFVD